MKTELDHLPAGKRRELERVGAILHDEFGQAMATGTSNWKKSGKILKIILFGSYARGGWVDEPHTTKGYQSDYDLLIIVNHKKLTDMADYWYQAEDRLMQEASIKTPVNFIVHTLDEVNRALSDGQYFFSDIRKDGIALYELKGQKTLAEAKPLTPQAAHEAARKYNTLWSVKSQDAFKIFRYCIEEEIWNDAAFQVHQTTERLYTCALLVLTNYSPKTHNVKFLRAHAERLDERFRDVWPSENRHDRRCFELLKRAYVEARYSEHYKITEEELQWLGARVEVLQALVEEVCREKLAKLAKEAGE